MSKRLPIIRVLLLVLVAAVMLSTAACVGMTEKTGTGEPAGSATSAIVSPSAVDFGNVPLHTNASRSFTLTNTGTTDLTIKRIYNSGLGYSTGGGGLSINTIVRAGSSLKFIVEFTPQAPGSVPGQLVITTTADPAPLEVKLAAVGVSGPGTNPAPAIEATPSSVSFGNVTVGTTDTQTMRLTNTGTANLTISRIFTSGTGFTASGLSIPLTLPSGQNTTFNASFKPTGTGAQTGSIVISSDANAAQLSIPLTGSGVTTNARLTASANSVNFGTVAVGSTGSQNVVLTNTGNTSVAITTVAAVGTGFTSTGGVNATLAPNQTVNVAVTFSPKAPGGVSGTMTVTSNASTVQVVLAGQGAGTPVSHSVTLNWSSSGPAVVGYNVYRGTVSGGPYTRVNPSADSSTSYTDSGVAGGQTYYYVVTAIDSSNVESAFSNQASVTVPTP